jgi:hypothetical protein
MMPDPTREQTGKPEQPLEYARGPQRVGLLMRLLGPRVEVSFAPIALVVLVVLLVSMFISSCRGL